jgi:hypothetical protein
VLLILEPDGTVTVSPTGRAAGSHKRGVLQKLEQQPQEAVAGTPTDRAAGPRDRYQLCEINCE